MRLEHTILSNLIHNEDYIRKVLPFIKDQYFQDAAERLIFKEIREFTTKYNNRPTREALKIIIGKLESLSEKTVEESYKVLDVLKLDPDEKTDQAWLIDNTEKFCQEKAVYNAVADAIEILNNKDTKKSPGSIPGLLTEALAVCFDNHVGHDYLNDAEKRWEYYHATENRIPFDLDYFNLITKGGLPPKTLNVFLAGTGVGKTLLMCHMAAACLSSGYDVLYITGEMAEERIAERIDTNLLDIPLDDLVALPKDIYDKKIERLRATIKGRLIIKEYPTASASVINFRTLLNELNLKKNFKPKIIFIDYINIFCSSRIKTGATVNSYTLVKAIAEEFRGLAVEFVVPIVTATQTNREGFMNSDVDLTNTAESFGLPATADFMGALISTEELEQLNQLMYKQLKNRYTDVAHNKRFVIGIDKSRMKLYNVEQSAQKDITDSGQQPVASGQRKFISTEGFKI